jgi:hypothetical protein
MGEVAKVELKLPVEADDGGVQVAGVPGAKGGKSGEGLRIQ